MNNILRFLFVALLLSIRMNPLYAQWTQTNGPYGGRVNSLAVSGTNLFAGTDGGGVFLSTNKGTNWTAVNTGLTNFKVRSLAVS
ncbi:MAG TPA: regulator, partial [bacterium]